MERGLGLGFTNAVETGECGTCICAWVAAVWVVYVGSEEWGMDWARIWDGCVMSVCVVSLDYSCRWQIQVSVYCAPTVQSCCTLSISASSVCLYVADIAIPDFMRVVVGPGLVSTSPVFMRSRANHPAGPFGRLAQKKEIGPSLLVVGGVDTICTTIC